MTVSRFDRLDYGRIVGLALSYVAAARVAVFHDASGASISPLSLPSGIALAALLILGLRYWPGIAFGAAVSAHISGLPLAQSLFEAVGNTLEPVVSVALLSAPPVDFDVRVRRLRDYLNLILFGAVLGPAAGAVIGASGLLLFGVPAEPAPLLIGGNGWMASALGVIVVTPWLLAFRQQWPRLADVKLEHVAAFSILMLWSAAVFGGWWADRLSPYAQAFTLFPLVGWIALRFGQRGVLPASLLVVAFAAYGASAEVGYFAHDLADTGLRNLWLYSVTLTVTGSALAMITSECRETLAKLRHAARVFDSTQEALMVTDPEGYILSVNPAFSEITGYDAAEVLGQSRGRLFSERHDTAFFEDQQRHLARSGRWQGEVWKQRKNGEIYPAWQTISTVADSDGQPVNYVTVFSDIAPLKVSQQKLEHLAHHDVLTGLPNRLLFRDRLEHAIQRADRTGSQLAVLFLDLDRFKHVNDSLGHTVGDALLQEVASRLRTFFRRDDTLARLGGDEFTILVEGLRQAADASLLADKLIQALSEPFQLQNYELLVGASIGISIYPQDAQSAESLLRNADAAMYRAKDSGRNTHEFYSKDMTDSALEQVVLEAQLRHAIEQQELQLYYQPQVDLVTGELVGLEALVRWLHPARGLVEPARFIQVAEETGLIVPLGEWVLHAACAQAKKWLDDGVDFGSIGVNVSASQVLRGTLKRTIEQALSVTGLPAERLEIEINESFIMRHPNQAIGQLIAIRDLGVQLAIDDFGTGHSSLAFLKQLPIDKLKIDRSFIQDLPGDINDAVIAKAVIALGHSLHFRVIAEGVETQGQRDFLRIEGCDEAQGFLYSQPMDAARAEEMVRSFSKKGIPDLASGFSDG